MIDPQCAGKKSLHRSMCNRLLEVSRWVPWGSLGFLEKWDSSLNCEVSWAPSFWGLIGFLYVGELLLILEVSYWTFIGGSLCGGSLGSFTNKSLFKDVLHFLAKECAFAL